MKIENKGLNELLSRFGNHKWKLGRAMNTTLQAILLIIWGSIPSYPTQDPESSYERTGTLGKSLGINYETGGKMGAPDIYQVKQHAGYKAAHFGTRLVYAPLVIGSSPEEQVRIHQGRWWTIPQTVVAEATKGVNRAVDIMVEEMAAWLKGKQQ